MNLSKARAHAETIRAAFAPACARIEIAGSVRREKADEIKDVELLMIPAPHRPMFGKFGAPILWLMDDLLEQGILRKRMDKAGRAAWGSLYQRAWWKIGDATVPLDLFSCEPGNWGAMLALRTGPDDFSHRLVTPRRFGGAMPENLRQEDGWLRRGGGRITEVVEEKVDTPEESDYFSALGLPMLPPSERTEARLVEMLRVKA